jgi:glutathione-regulated potassium-efflux system ancillary protein KefC/glutathione-regulated potassium-efflux system protein KefB
LVVVVTLTMALTPALVALNSRYLSKLFGAEEKRPYDKIEAEDGLVIVAGFGRFGQIIGRILRMMKLEFTALEANADQVEALRRFGNKVYYGDASKIELLRAAGAEKARVLVVAIDDMKASLKTVAVARQHFPDLKILARARNREHVFRLRDLGVTQIWRETYASSLEMADSLLQDLGIPAARAKRSISRFRAYDDELLIEQHKVYQDETQLIDVSKRAQKQLIETLEADRAEDLEQTTSP